MSVYEMNDEERRIVMVSLAGFELEDGERRTVRPLYMRMLKDFDPTLIRHPPPDSSDFERHCIACPDCNRKRTARHASQPFEPIPIRDIEHASIASAINAVEQDRERANVLHRWLDAAARAFREVVANDVAQVKAANEGFVTCPVHGETYKPSVSEVCGGCRRGRCVGCGETLAMRQKGIEREVVFSQIDAERQRQDRQWGGSHHDNAHARRDWLGFIDDHNGRAKAALSATARHKQDLDEYRKQLVEVAALAIAAIEAHDRKGSVG